VFIFMVKNLAVLLYLSLVMFAFVTTPFLYPYCLAGCNTDKIYSF
jgi:hypothetical protein